MKIDYIRTFMSSHMVLEQIDELEEWEERMIIHASIDGVLFGERVGENGENRLWYDITGKQSLDVILESMELRFELLGRILTRIYETVEKLEEFLLRQDGLLLEPECIFVDYRTEEICFCYYPGNAKCLRATFRVLMEYLLTRLDYQDELAVTLAYNVHEWAVKGDGSFRELNKLLCVPYDKEETTEDEREDSGDIAFEETMGKEPGEDMRVKEEKKRGKHSVWEKCINWLSARLKIQGLQALGQKKEEESFVFEPEEEEEPKGRPTVLLTTLSACPEGILRYEGKGECRDLNITGTSYLIGSGPDCEGMIPSATVSRRHARITRTEDIYFIEDLNSSNGTYVGGQMLNYKTRMSLQKNEIVVFADEKFRFI